MKYCAKPVLVKHSAVSEYELSPDADSQSLDRCKGARIVLCLWLDAPCHPENFPC